MPSEDDLRNQLEKLRQENLKLKDQLQEKSTFNTTKKVIRYSYGSYKGHPVITFEGPGRPFSIGLKKASVILACKNVLESFVHKHSATLSDYSVESNAHPPEASPLSDGRI